MSLGKEFDNYLEATKRRMGEILGEDWQDKPADEQRRIFQKVMSELKPQYRKGLPSRDTTFAVLQTQLAKRLLPGDS